MSGRQLWKFRGCVLAFAAVACAAGSGCTTAPAPQEVQRDAVLASMPVPDGQWALVTSSFVGTGRIPGVPRATLAFRNGELSAFSGCNNANATVRNFDGRLEVLVFNTTRRSCAEPLGAFETRFFKLLRAQPVLHIEADTLTLTAGDENATFRRVLGRPAGREP